MINDVAIVFVDVTSEEALRVLREADRDRLQQVPAHLLNNAAQRFYWTLGKIFPIFGNSFHTSLDPPSPPLS